MFHVSENNRSASNGTKGFTAIILCILALIGWQCGPPSVTEQTSSPKYTVYDQEGDAALKEAALELPQSYQKEVKFSYWTVDSDPFTTREREARMVIDQGPPYLIERGFYLLLEGQEENKDYYFLPIKKIAESKQKDTEIVMYEVKKSFHSPLQDDGYFETLEAAVYLKGDTIVGLVLNNDVRSRAYHNDIRPEFKRLPLEDIKQVEGFDRDSTVTTQSEKSSEPVQNTVKLRKHKVKRGETLSDIAKRYGTTVQSLKEVNNLRNNKIRTDKILKVPNEKEN